MILERAEEFLKGCECRGCGYIFGRAGLYWNEDQNAVITCPECKRLLFSLDLIMIWNGNPEKIKELHRFEDFIKTF